jgi:hypothetical protein
MKTKTKLALKLIVIAMTMIASQNSLAASLTPITLSIPPLTTNLSPPPPPPLITVLAPVPTLAATYDLQATPINIGYVILNAGKGEVSLCKPPASIDPTSSNFPQSSCWFIDTVYPSKSGAALTSQPGSNTVLRDNKDNGSIWACTFGLVTNNGSTQASGACTGISDMGHALPNVTQPW